MPGFVLLEKGDTEEALEVWQRGSRACGGDPSLAYNLSQLYRSRGETTKAFEVMIASLCMFPDDVDLMAGLGELWEALGNTAKARRYYRSAGRLAPGRTDIQQMRVRVGG